MADRILRSAGARGLSKTPAGKDGEEAEGSAGSASQDELTATEEFLATERIASQFASRVESFESTTVAMPEGMVVAGTEADTGSGAVPPGEAGSSASSPPGETLFGSADDLRADHVAGTQASDFASPEAKEAVDTFNSVAGALRSGLHPEVGSGQAIEDITGPRLSSSGSDPFHVPSVAEGGSGSGYGMNEYFTKKALELAEKGDLEGLERLSEQVRQHYGKAGQRDAPAAPPEPTGEHGGGTPINDTVWKINDDGEVEWGQGKVTARWGPSVQVVKKAQEEEAKAQQEAARKAEEAAQQAEAGQETEQPPDGFIDPEKAVALHDWLNRMTGYEAAKTLPKDIDPGRYDDGEARGDYSDEDPLKGDNRGGEFVAMPPPDAGDLPSPGNVDGNITPGEANDFSGEVGLTYDVPTDIGRSDRNLAYAFQSDESDGRGTVEDFDAGEQTYSRGDSWMNWKPVLVEESDDTSGGDDFDDA